MADYFTGDLGMLNEREIVMVDDMREVARMEIDAARRLGIDPMDLVSSHRVIAQIIPSLLETESKDGGAWRSDLEGTQ